MFQSEMDQPDKELYHPIWTSQTETNAIPYELAEPDIVPSYMDQPVKYISISNGPAGVPIIPSYTDQPNKEMYHPIWMGPVRYVSISNGPAGQNKMPSYMNRLDQRFYHPIWTSRSNIFQSLMDRPDRT